MLTAALKSGAVRTYTLLTETRAFCGLFVFSVEFFLKIKLRSCSTFPVVEGEVAVIYTWLKLIDEN
jgi:hypothetical protein